MKLIEIKRVPVVWNDNIHLLDHTTELLYDNYIINGDFDCSHTKIKTLEGSPVEVTGDFDCSWTEITSFKGCPRKIGGQINCEHTPIRSLHNIHKHLKYIGGLFVIPGEITSHILGALLINGSFWLAPAYRVDRLGKAIKILNNQLLGSKPRNIHQAQEEMIEKGLEEFAQL